MPHVTSLWLALVTLVLLTRPIDGFPDGPPLSACSSMQPGTQVGTTGMEGHVAKPRNNLPGKQNKCPYYIHIYQEPKEYLGQEEISVGIIANQTTDSAHYMGFLMQARQVICKSDTTVQVANEPLGTFIITSPLSLSLVKTLDCGGIRGSAVCHKSRQFKINETVTWKAPDHVGHIVFHATMVQDVNTYWKDVFSPILQQPGIGDPATCAATSPQLTVLLLVLSALFLKVY